MSAGAVCGVGHRLAAIQSLMEQVATEVSDVEPLVMTSIAADQVPIVAQDWSSVKSSVSTLSAAIQTIAHHISAAPPPPPSQPDTTAAADGDNAVDVTANRLPADVYCDGIVGYLPVDVAISPARAANTLFGTQLINEAFMLKRIDGSLDSNHLTGLVDVYRSMFGYYSKCAFVLERGGALWQQMADFIHLARNRKLIKALPLQLSPQWTADHLATKTAFDELPLALAVYSTFGHLLSHRGTSLALQRVDEEQEDADDGGNESGQDSDSAMDDRSEQHDADIGQQHQAEGGGGSAIEEGAGRPRGGQPGDGSGGVTRQRYRIGNIDFTTVPLSDLPPTYPYRATYDAANPAIRRGDYLYPSFTTFIKRTVLLLWYDQEGAQQKLVAAVFVGRDDTRYWSLLTAATVEGCEIVDLIEERGFDGDDDRRRLIILKGTKATDTIVAYLWLVDGNIRLHTTEAPTEDRTAIERYPLGVTAARPLLTEYRLERALLG